MHMREREEEYTCHVRCTCMSCDIHSVSPKGGCCPPFQLVISSDVVSGCSDLCTLMSFPPLPHYLGETLCEGRLHTRIHTYTVHIYNAYTYIHCIYTHVHVYASTCTCTYTCI